jgi:hypothetical protein
MKKKSSADKGAEVVPERPSEMQELAREYCHELPAEVVLEAVKLRLILLISKEEPLTSLPFNDLVKLYQHIKGL